MSTRKIKVLSTVGTSGTIETNVTTLGALKPLLAQQGITFDGMTLMVGETRNTLSLDDAVLPTEDFKLYLMPAKTKSGSSRKAELFQTLAEAYAELADLEEGDEPSYQSTIKEEEDPDMADLRRVASGESRDWLV